MNAIRKERRLLFLTVFGSAALLKVGSLTSIANGCQLTESIVMGASKQDQIFKAINKPLGFFPSLCPLPIRLQVCPDNGFSASADLQYLRHANRRLRR